MTKKNEVAMSKEQMEATMYAAKIADASGEKVNTFESLPTISVFNKAVEGADKDGLDPKLGDIIKSTRTEQDWKREIMENPFNGVVLKVRNSLRTKFKLKEKGADELYSSEFTDFRNEIITVRQKEWDVKEGKNVFKEVFKGTYHQVIEKYSFVQFGAVEKMLDFVVNLYVVLGLDTDEPQLVKMQIKGMSRGNWFDYTKEFTRRDGDYISTNITEFGTKLVDETRDGTKLAFTVAAFDFTKKGILPIASMKKLSELQDKFEEELKERDHMFNNPVKEAEVAKPAQIENSKQVEEELPTIDIDEEDNSEIKTSDLPF